MEEPMRTGHDMARTLLLKEVEKPTSIPQWTVTLTTPSMRWWISCHTLFLVNFFPVSSGNLSMTTWRKASVLSSLHKSIFRKPPCRLLWLPPANQVIYFICLSLYKFCHLLQAWGSLHAGGGGTCSLLKIFMGTQHKSGIRKGMIMVKPQT